MRALKSVILLSLVLAFGSACSKKSETTDAQQGTNPTSVQAPTPSGSPSAAASDAAANASATSGQPDLSIDSSGLSKTVVVVKTSKGTFKFKFYPKEAPNTVKRFIELTQQKFYNGLSFHRVVPGFVVQTGDPKSKNKSDPSVGTGGSGVKQKAEFNARKHVRGTVAMARSADVDSADSQFYVALGTFPHLDEKYTVFGQVVDFGEKVDGKDVVERISQGDDMVDVHLE